MNKALQRGVDTALVFCLTAAMFASHAHAKHNYPSPSLSAHAIKTHHLTRNDRYNFTVKDGKIYVKSHENRSVWHRVPLDSPMENQIREIAVDGDTLVASDTQNRIFLMDNALEKRSRFRWTSRWGVPFGLDKRGLQLPASFLMWDFSFISPRLDWSYTDSIGQDHMIGVGVETLFAVGGDGQKIYYFDPWLPPDLTNQACGPLRGRVRIAALATLGSTLAVLDVYGNVFVRRFDFDIGGGDIPLIMGYSYEMREPKDDLISWLRAAPRKLPVPDWLLLPKIKGIITTKVSLERIGLGARVRLVRVEGMQHNRTGYFEARVDFIEQSPDLPGEKPPITWAFHATDRPLEGTKLNNVDDLSKMDIRASGDQSFMMRGSDSYVIELPDFHQYCTPAQMRVTFFNDNSHLDLILHHTEILRIARRKPNAPLWRKGTVEIPQDILDNFANLTPAQKSFIKDHFHKRRFSRVGVKASPEKIRVIVPNLHVTSWKFFPHKQKEESS